MPKQKPETEEQTRAIKALMSEPSYARADVRVLADGSREVWAYNVFDSLVAIHTVFSSGRTATRPGYRVTTDRYIGDPRD